jgi:hypothetical protein
MHQQPRVTLTIPRCIVPELDRRAQKCLKQGFQRGRRSLRQKLAQQRAAAAVDFTGAALDNGFEQLLLAAEVIVQQRRIDPGARRNRPSRGAVKAVFRKLRLGRIKQAFGSILRRVEGSQSAGHGDFLQEGELIMRLIKATVRRRTLSSGSVGGGVALCFRDGSNDHCIG